MNSFITMVVANLRMQIRNRQALFWNLAFPAIFIIMFGLVFNNNGGVSSFDVGIAGGNTHFRSQVVSAMRGSDIFNVHEGTADDELAALENDDRTVVLVFPNDANASSVDLYSSNTGGPNSQIAVSATRQVVSEVAGAAGGFTINAKAVSTRDATYIDWFVPGILAMSLMNSGIIGIATSFVAYRERGILRRIKVTPFPLWKFLTARIVSGLIMSLITSGILIGVGKVLWGLNISGNWGVILIAFVLSAVSMLAIGYAIAAISRNTETAASYSNLITFPMMFLTGVFFPIGTLPGWLSPLIAILPLKYAVDALRTPMLDGEGLMAISRDLAVLAGFAVVALAFAVRYFKWDAATR